VRTQRKIGIALIITGAILFVVGVSMFTYRGEINPIVNLIGEYSFIGWFPTLLLGIVLAKKK
jgi:hypothetical protein